MKNLYLTARGGMTLDKNNEPESWNSDREAISSVYAISEPTHIVYSRTDKRIELDAQEGDIVIVFYESAFIHPVIVVNSKEWLENITDYRVKDQKRKEEWAKKAKERMENDYTPDYDDYQSLA